MKRPRRLLLVVLTGLATAPRGVGTSAVGWSLARVQAGATGPRECVHVRRTRETWLSPDVSAYVEASAVVRAGNDLLVTGTPSFEWKHVGDSVTMLSRDELIGLVVQRERVLGVRSPIPGRQMRFPRAVSLGPSHWGVFVPEVNRVAGADVNDWATVTRLFFGELRGAQWTDFVELPIPDSMRLETYFSSSPVVIGDTIRWLTPATPRNDGRNTQLWYERRGRRWQVDTTGIWSSYVSLVGSARGGSFAVTVPTAGDFLEINGVTLYRLNAGRWERERRVVDGGSNPLYAPTLEAHDGTFDIGWIRESPHATATTTFIGVASLGESRSPQWMTEDTLDTEQLLNVTKRSARARPIWLTNRINRVSDAREVRFWWIGPDGRTELGHLQHTLKGWVAAERLADGDIAVVGGRLDRRRGAPPAITQLIIFRDACRAR